MRRPSNVSKYKRICAKSYRRIQTTHTCTIGLFNFVYDSFREHYVSSYVCFAYGLEQNAPLICLYLFWLYMYRLYGFELLELLMNTLSICVEIVRVGEAHFMRSECAHKCRTHFSGGFCIGI